jgi:hypothetical protein
VAHTYTHICVMNRTSRIVYVCFATDSIAFLVCASESPCYLTSKCKVQHRKVCVCVCVCECVREHRNYRQRNDEY